MEKDVTKILVDVNLVVPDTEKVTGVGMDLEENLNMRV